MRLISGFLMILLWNSSSVAQSYNTATGAYALYSITSGGANTATGYLSSSSLTTGWNNTSHGTYSLLQNVVGNSNSAFGSRSQYSNYNGNENVSLGYRTLYSNFGGGQNTACGVESAYYTGTNSGTSIGYRALYYTSSGGTNLGIGAFAGLSNNSGSNNTYIGYGSDNHSTASSETGYVNTTIIGAFTRKAPNDTSNKITVGTGIGTIGGSTTWTNWSDRRIKESIQEDVPGLNFINKLRAVTYKINMNIYTNMVRNPIAIGEAFDTSTNHKTLMKADIEYGNIVRTGFIAQEVLSAADNIGYQFSGVLKPTDDKGLYSLSYEQFVIPLVKSAQELNTGNNSLRAKLDILKTKYQNMLDQINTLKKQVGM